MDFLCSCVSKILEPIIATITAPMNRHIGYVSQFRSNVQGLRDEVDLLKVARANLQGSIEVAERLRGEEVFDHVLEWRVKADAAIGEAQTPLQNGQEEAQRCCSLRLATRYRISKKAAETTPGIAQLLKQKKELGEPIARPRQLHQIENPVPVEGFEAKSRTKILKEVMDALLDPSITMVGVWGMGGIGKTTLAEEVQRQVKTTLAEEVQSQAKSSFDQVIKVTATQEVKEIQKKILGLFREPELEDDIDVRAARIKQILEKKKVLIIVDDLWSVLEPYKMGIPSWNDGKGCKLLLTSRNEDILSKMGSQKNFPLGFLSKEDSRSLFEKTVNRIQDHDIAEQILAKCDGFPLLIVKVGELIQNKDIYHWKNALTQLSKFQDGKAVEKVHSVVEFSYKNLDDEETKQIFLLIGISRKSDTTMINLLRYALGLGLFKGYTLCQARNRLKTMIDHLKACSLLEDYEQGNLKMHDLVREIAIRIARKKKYAFRERDDKVLKEWPSSGETSGCTVVSVPQSSDILQLPGDLGCPDVELLLLYSNGHPVDIPDSTFEGTTKLKVIHFARMELASLPIRPSSHSNLHTLCLEDCSLLDLTTITQLERLEILSLRGSPDLEALPREIGKLTRMKVLDLSDCSKLRFIPADVISKLTSLEELLMRNSFDDWEVDEEGTDGSEVEEEGTDGSEVEEDGTDGSKNARLSEVDEEGTDGSEVEEEGTDGSEVEEEGTDGSKNARLSEVDEEGTDGSEVEEDGTDGSEVEEAGTDESEVEEEGTDGSKNARLSELKCLPRLDLLVIRVPDTQALSKDFSFDCLERFQILIGEGSMFDEGSEITKTLKLEGDMNADLFQKVRELLRELEILHLIGPMLSFIHLFDLENEGFPNLKELLLKGEGSDLLQQVVDCKRQGATVYFPLLESLALRELTSMVTICKGRPAPESFSQMKRLEIEDCPQLKNLFLLSAVGSLPQLEEIDVRDCDGMEALFVAEGNEVVEFPRLRRLFIYYCPKLKNLFSLSAVGSLPQLEEIVVLHCDEMEALFVAEGNEVVEFPRLRCLEIWRSHRLKCFLAKENPIGLSSSENAERELKPFFSEKVALPTLETLTIRYNDSIEMIWSSQLASSAFQKLNSVEISDCDKLQKLWPSSSLGRFQNLKSLTVDRCNALEEIYQFRNGVADDQMVLALTKLALSDLPRLKGICKEDSSGQYHSLQNLESISISACESLENLFPPVVAKTLSQLESIQVRRCGKLTQIVAEEEEISTVDGRCSLFPLLKSLKIEDCPHLPTGSSQIHFANSSS